MIREGIFAHDEEKEVAPLGVVGGAEIEDDRDERPDVGKANCLGVEVGDGSSLASTSFGFQESALIGLRLGTCGAIGLGFAETIELGALIAGERHGQRREDAGLGLAGGES